MTDTAQQAPVRDEVVTHAHVQDVELPGGAGTFALITLDNGFDHTKPNSFGPGGLTELSAALDTLAERATQGEIVGAGITGKPFIFAVGADITGIPSITDREQACRSPATGTRPSTRSRNCPCRPSRSSTGARLGGGVEVALYADYRTISSDVPAYALPSASWDWFRAGVAPTWCRTSSAPRRPRS